MNKNPVINDNILPSGNGGDGSVEQLLKLPEKSIYRPSIYLMYDIKDAGQGSELARLIRSLGFEVHEPVFHEDIILLRRYHQSCLTQSDFMIVVALEANIEWVNMKIVDIIKSPGFGRAKPIHGKMIVWDRGRTIKPVHHSNIFDIIDHNDAKNTAQALSALLSSYD